MVEKSSAKIVISPAGVWDAFDLQEVDMALRRVDFSCVTTCVIDLKNLIKIDTAGGMILTRFKNRLEDARIKVIFKNGKEQVLRVLEQIFNLQPFTPHTLSVAPSDFFRLQKIGRIFYKGCDHYLILLGFFGQLIEALLQCFAKPAYLRVRSIVRFIELVGVNALPIVGLISFLIGVVLVYQGADQLRQFGAEIYTVNLLAVSMLREIGILLTAIVVAGRSGSSFAAQIGTMKINQEIDSIQTFGLNPFHVLVIPRIFAVLISLPLLTIFSDLMGLLGGAAMASILLDINFSQFMDQLFFAITPWTFGIGLVKAPVFGLIIGIIGCFEGFQVEGDASSVGKKTTRAVVESIFLVIIVDAFFSIFFSYWGI